MSSSIRFGLMIVLGTCLSWSTASAQYAPDASADLGTGHGQIALGQSALDGTRALDKQNTSKQKPAKKQATQPDRARMLVLMRSVEPEHTRRVREDGEASAKRWLARKARDLGRDEGAPQARRALR